MDIFLRTLLSSWTDLIGRLHNLGVCPTLSFMWQYITLLVCPSPVSTNLICVKETVVFPVTLSLDTGMRSFSWNRVGPNIFFSIYTVSTCVCQKTNTPSGTISQKWRTNTTEEGYKESCYRPAPQEAYENTLKKSIKKKHMKETTIISATEFARHVLRMHHGY